MKLFFYAVTMAVALVVSAPAKAEIVKVTASANFFGQAIGPTTQLRRRVNDNILGNNLGNSQGRYLALRFDETEYVSLAQDPNATLTSAILAFGEADGSAGGPDRDGSNGNRIAFVDAFFSDEGNSGLTISTGNSFVGNSGARAGVVGGGAIGTGATNINAAHTGFSSGTFQFTTGSRDEFTIDLSGGIALADIQSILSDDDTSNAEIFLQASDVATAFAGIASTTGLDQIFFDDSFELRLTFDVATVPEPSSMIALGLVGVVVATRRRRR